MTVNILSISESDVKGLRGIQADAKTTSALGCNLFSVPTFNIDEEGDDLKCNVAPISHEFIEREIKKTIDEKDIAVIKVGSLYNETILNSVVDAVETSGIKILTEPNFVTRCGKIIYDRDMIAAFKRRVLLISDVLVLNIKEAEILTGMKINGIDDMSYATMLMRAIGVDNVVLKAGQAISNKIVYFVANEDKELLFKRDKIDGRGTLGSGSLFTNQISLSIANGIDVFQAVEDAINILHKAISTSKYNEQEAGWLNLDFIHDTNSNTIVEEVDFKKRALE